MHLCSGAKRVHAAGENTVMKDGALNMSDLTSRIFIDADLGISLDPDFHDGGEILFAGAGGYFQTQKSS